MFYVAQIEPRAMEPRAFNGKTAALPETSPTRYSDTLRLHPNSLTPNWAFWVSVQVRGGGGGRCTGGCETPRQVRSFGVTRRCHGAKDSGNPSPGQRTRNQKPSRPGVSSLQTCLIMPRLEHRRCGSQGPRAESLAHVLSKAQPANIQKNGVCLSGVVLEFALCVSYS